jgi:hypothetical protein
MQALRRFFASPAREAAAWSTLGILGLALAGVGLLLYDRDASPVRRVAAASDVTQTATASPSATATPPATATLTVLAQPSPTTVPAVTQSLSKPETARDDGGSEPAETASAKPTAVATAILVVAGGPYCSTISNGRPPSTVIGTFTIGGVAAPLGTAVTLAFDGVPGPSGNSGLAAGGYHLDYAPGGSDCANRVGATITVVYDGVAYGAGQTVRADASGAPARIDIAAP